MALAVGQHHDAIGELHDCAHYMLDEDDGRSLVADGAYELDRLVHFRGRQAG